MQSNQTNIRYSKGFAHPLTPWRSSMHMKHARFGQEHVHAWVHGPKSQGPAGHKATWYTTALTCSRIIWAPLTYTRLGQSYVYNCWCVELTGFACGFRRWLLQVSCAPMYNYIYIYTERAKPRFLRKTKVSRETSFNLGFLAKSCPSKSLQILSRLKNMIYTLERQRRQRISSYNLINGSP